MQEKKKKNILKVVYNNPTTKKEKELALKEYVDLIWKINDLTKEVKELSIPVVTKRFNDLTDALGYLNRGGHYFEERNTLEDATIIAIANDIYYKKNRTYQTG